MKQIADQLRQEHGLWVRGLTDLSAESLRGAVAAGGRFVVYEYCISLLVATLRGRSVIWFRRADQGRRWPGVRYSLLSLFLGWWGVPWGFLYTPWSIFTNLAGGQDVTDELLPLLSQPAAASEEVGDAP